MPIETQKEAARYLIYTYLKYSVGHRFKKVGLGKPGKTSIYIHTHTHTHTHIYIYIYISTYT
jgi:hypothetical protein